MTQQQFTAADVAKWMADQVKTKCLYQESAASLIRRTFGPQFTYRNKNGNWGIGPDVLKEFRKLTDGEVVWEKGQKMWRKSRPNEKAKGKRAVE